MPNWIQAADESCLRWIAETLRTPLLNALMVVYTTLGNGGMLFIALTVLLLAFRATRKVGLSTGTGMILGLVVTNLTVKPLMARPRPWVVMEGFASLVRSSDPNSFPSGHTCAAFAFAAAVCVAAPWKWMKAAALIAAALMGCSRLYVGVHFPSDVLAGVVIGTLCGLAGAWLVKKITEFVQRRQAAE